MTAAALAGMGAELKLDGERFLVSYRISAADEALARARATELCIEQTVEFPADLLPPGPIPDLIVGRLERLVALSEGAWLAGISYAVELAGGELAQLLNVIFGNSSLKPGLRVEGLELTPSLAARFAGPRFGVVGLRELVGAAKRPLLCTALKPLGLSPKELAELAYAFALGGIDLIKDDHGLADQPFCRFEERVTRCAAAVAEANAKTGGRSRYAPNITHDAEHLPSRAAHARLAGAGALLAAPGLLGFATVKKLADEDAIGLPLLAHPAFLGSFVVYADAGIAPGLLFGELPRLAGCDATIFPNHGGRFAFDDDDCRSIAAGCGRPLGGDLAPIFPCPAGGMQLERVAELRAFYGDDSLLLIGGDLHRGDDLVASCRRFRELVEA